MATIITRPTNLRAVDWANNVCSDLREFGIIGSLVREEDWRSWGSQLLNNAALGNNLPNPYQFAEWRPWAERLCDALS